MPRGDGTGPMGMGAMTGRGAGFCSGYSTPGYANFSGNYAAFGRGRGCRNMFYATGLPRWSRNRAYYGAPVQTVNEKESLSRQAEFLENQLNEIKEQIANFDENAE